METIIVTRHKELVTYLTQVGLIEANCPVLPHATPESVAGKHVIGVLPLHLAALAAKVTVVPLNLPAELRGIELSIEQVRKYAGPAQTYKVLDTEGMKAVDDSCWGTGNQPFYGLY